MIVDYYLHRRQRLDLDGLYDMTGGPYHYRDGWNDAAVKAFGLAAVFSVATVWVPWFAVLEGYNWVIGAILGGVLYNAMAKGRPAA
jgi:NCS1 family nucleobase:cation symporter-1